MNMGEKILKMRKARGWSQEELAEQVGVTRQAVSRWEAGSAKPDADKIITISDLFGVSADYLLRDTYEGEPGMNQSNSVKTTALGDAVRAMTLWQSIGAIFTGLGLLGMLVLKILSSIFPHYYNGISGLWGFLYGNDVESIWYAACFCLIFGLVLWLFPPVRKLFGRVRDFGSRYA